MMQTDYRWLLVFGCNLLLIWLVALANHYLSRFGFLWIDYVTLHLYLGGLFVTFAALRLDVRNGLIATLATGLAIDAQSPAAFGTSVLLLGLVHAALLYNRNRFPREETVFAIVVALLANLFLFLVMSFLFIGHNPRPGHAWLRLFMDLIASQLVIALITPWFMALQEQVFARAEIHPETGRRVLS